jgi:hypothetical protein
MTDEYGPWATSIGAGVNPQLSTFWRRRLSMLVPTSRASLVLSRRSLAWLIAAGALLIGVPTFLVGTAVADEDKPAEAAKKIAPNGATEHAAVAGERPARQKQGRKPEKASPAAEAARTAYEATVKQYDTGLADVEAVYRWSCRWMEAERPDRGAAAIQSHISRMQSFYDKIAKLHENGVRGGEEANFAAAHYYVVEAREMLKKMVKKAKTPATS